MGSCAPCPSLLKVWISWVKGGLLLRILGLPAVLLALHLEIYGSSPRNTSLILHRLSKRFRLSRLACQFDQNHEHIEHINQHHDTSVAAATIIYTQQQKKKRTVMPPASSRPTPKTSNLSSPKRSKTPDNKQRSRRPSPGASPAAAAAVVAPVVPPAVAAPPPLPLFQHSEQDFDVPATPLLSTSATPLLLSPSPTSPTTPSPNPRPRPLPIESVEQAATPRVPQPLVKQFEPSTPTSQPSPVKSPLETPAAATPRPLPIRQLEAPIPTPQPTPVKQVEEKVPPRSQRPQLLPVKQVEASAPTPQRSPLRLFGSVIPTPQTARVKRSKARKSHPLSVESIEATHAPLPNTSATRAPPTPRPEAITVNPFETVEAPLPQALVPPSSVESSTAPLVPASSPLVPSVPASAPLVPSRPALSRPQLPPTALELETFKALLRSNTPQTPCPEPRPLPVARSKTSDSRLSNASASRKPQPHPSDAEAFEKFKALLRASQPSPALTSPKFKPQSMPLQESEVSDFPPFGSPTSTPAHPFPSAPSTPMSRPSSHTRSMSHASVVTRSSKRLSLQFPIQPSPNLTPKLRPQSWVAAPSPMSPTVADVSPTETNLLAILAAQERYVLELKEELKKAEEDLGTLKKHWANNEFLKQRNDSRKVTQLQPLNTTLANLKVDSEDDTGSPAWVQRETDRRKALHSGQKITNRKVFSGSRHLRTLSLLSPDTLAANYQPSFPHPHDIRDGIDESITRTHTLIRHATTPDMAKHMSETQTDDQFELGVSTAQREAIVRTSKKLATDFKDGLFSFIDDIRQATVGDEASDGLVSPSGKAPTTKTARKVSEGRPGLNRATSSKKSSQKVDAIADDFWKEHGLIETKAVPTAKKTHTTKTARTPQKPSKDLEELEDWDNWDTPNDKYTKVAEHHSSDSEESSSPVSGLSSSRTSTRYHSQRHDSKASSLTSISSSGPAEDIVLRENTKRNSLQWPDLVKFSPTNLKRTASHLMKEWEQSLTPPPESRVSDHSSGDYVGRSTTPPDLL